jgi:hypothetical protein
LTIEHPRLVSKALTTHAKISQMDFPLVASTVKFDK